MGGIRKRKGVQENVGTGKSVKNVAEKRRKYAKFGYLEYGGVACLVLVSINVYDINSMQQQNTKLSLCISFSGVYF